MSTLASLTVTLPFAGAVEWAGESCLWLRCFYGALGGMLLRLADVKRKDKAFYTNAVRCALFPDETAL